MPTARKPAAKKSKVTKATEPRLSRTRRPPDLPAADWQTALRRQFGREQHFGFKNLGSEPVFSDFAVSNPASRSHYRVAIRGTALGQNFCTCPDFATNDLGTCKHIEFTLGKLQAKRGGKAALKRGFESAYSEIWLDYAGQRQVRLHVAGVELQHLSVQLDDPRRILGLGRQPGPGLHRHQVLRVDLQGLVQVGARAVVLAERDLGEPQAHQRLLPIRWSRLPSFSPANRGTWPNPTRPIRSTSSRS